MTRDVTPEEFAALIQKSNAIAFIGSGLSTGIYPSWSDLIDDLMRACNIAQNGGVKIPTSAQLMDHAELALVADAKKFEQRLHELFGWQTLKSVRIEYDAVADLPFSSFLTTNIDPCLRYACQRKYPLSGFHKYPMLPITKLSEKAAFYLHGFAGGKSPPRAEEIVLARSIFDVAYKDGTRLHAMLQEVFMFRTVVFMGCSLSEPPLERIFERCRTERDKFISENKGVIPPAKYILLPKFSTSPGATLEERAREIEAETAKEEKLHSFGVSIMRYASSPQGEHDGLRYFLTEAARINAPEITNPFDSSL